MTAARRRTLHHVFLSTGLLALSAVAHAVPVVTLTATPTPVKESKSFVLSAAGSYDNDPTTYIFRYDFYRFDPGIGWTLLYTGTANAIGTTAPAVGPAGQTYTYQVNAYNLYGQLGFADVNQPVLYNPPPVANAGPNQRTRELRPGVQLDGSASKDPEGAPLAYAWTQIAGTPVTLSATTVAKPTFTAPIAPQVLTFQLVVTESDGKSSPPSFTSVGVETNQPPTNVDAGPQQEVAPGATVTLKGTATDPNTDPLSYKWTQISGPRTITLTGADSSTATFKAPSVTADETYVFHLDVTDGVATASDETSVVVRAAASAAGLPLVSNQKTFPSPFNPSAGAATIQYTLRSPADVNMRISDIFGRQVRELSAAAGAPGGSAGDNDVQWDGRNGDGELVSNGLYVVQVDAKDASGAQGKVTDRVGVRR